MIIKQIPCGPLSTNSYVLHDSRNALLIDPAEFKTMNNYLEQNSLFLHAVLLSHGHFDHMLALPELRHTFPGVPIYIHPQDEVLLYSSEENGSSAFIGPCSLESSEKVDLYQNELDTPLGTIEIISTPGHTPGSVSLYLQTYLFTGDFLFKESIGRTDFSRGSPRDMQDSLKEFVHRFYPLAEALIIYPGHGEATNLIHELQFNPFLDRMTKHMGQ